MGKPDREYMSSVASTERTWSLLGTPIHGITMAEALDRVDVAITRRDRLHIAVINAAKLVNMRRDPVLRRDVVTADLVVADGMSIVWAGRLLGLPVPERVAGIDLMLEMLRRGDERSYRIYCLGATTEILDLVAARLATDYPRVQVVGRRHGYFSADEEPGIVAEIASARPDILFVAMSSPKKEAFLSRWRDQLGVPVCHGVGGSFDVFAGKVSRAPERWQRLGLEWLYRLKQEPRRLWRRYLVTNTIFCAMVAGEMWTRFVRTLSAASSRHRA
jgi:N-acetylglucosaminyldiphosphoundecaprenol N-acetyl-beta-D-mannosaminyltransferase